MKPLHAHLSATRPASYFSMASGGLGFGLPAAIGIALAERHTGRNRPVIAVIGDGSFRYSVQSLYTAARHDLPLLVVVPDNHEYATLKSFAAQEGTPNVPGLDLPGLDLVAIAQGFGCAARRVERPEEVTAAAREALASGKPTVLQVSITSEVPPPL